MNEDRGETPSEGESDFAGDDDGQEIASDVSEDPAALCGNGVVEESEECEGEGAESCVTTCGSPGGRACLPGCIWSECTATDGEPGACNEIDDDCDGRTDEAVWCAIPIPDSTPPVAALRGVHGTAPDDVWVVGDWGIALHWNGVELSVVPTGTLSHLWGVWAVSSDYAWAVGEAESILRWEGTEWSRSFGPSAGGAFHAVWAATEDEAWAVGEMDSAYRWDGTEWSPVSTGLSGGLDDIWGSGIDDVWAAGPAGVAHWDGREWSRTWTPGTPVYFGVWGSSSEDVWATSIGAIHWQGDSWTVVDGRPFSRGDDVWGCEGGDIWFASDSEHLWRVTGGEWSAEEVPWPDGDLQLTTGVWCSPEGDVWAVGLNASVFRWRY